jgi:hypothetical protein
MARFKPGRKSTSNLVGYEQGLDGTVTRVVSGYVYAPLSALEGTSRENQGNRASVWGS